MMFWKKSKRARQNDRDVDARNEIAEACLNPEYLVEKLSNVLFKKTKDTSGHIHFHFRNKSDHVIFVWSKGKLKKIGAKSPGCKKRQYVHWNDSQFCNYKREDVLRKLNNEIELIEIDGEGFNKAWLSYTELIKWLIEN